LLSSYKRIIIKELSQIEQQEVCWHIAQVLPRLEYTAEQEKEIIEILKRYLSHKSKIVNVNAMEALVDLAEKNQTIVKEVIDTIRLHVETGSPAIQARGRNLLKRLNVKGE
jgi:hypothetical protein